MEEQKCTFSKNREQSFKGGLHSVSALDWTQGEVQHSGSGVGVRCVDRHPVLHVSLVFKGRCLLYMWTLTSTVCSFCLVFKPAKKWCILSLEGKCQSSNFSLMVCLSLWWPLAKNCLDSDFETWPKMRFKISFFVCLFLSKSKCVWCDLTLLVRCWGQFFLAKS